MRGFYKGIFRVLANQIHSRVMLELLFAFVQMFNVFDRVILIDRRPDLSIGFCFPILGVIPSSVYLLILNLR